MPSSDKTKEVLEQILAQIYAEQASAKSGVNGSFLQAHDKQFLGTITANQYDNDSILNIYGPYGSQYSNTSIFNPYSPYGSEYGALSVNNPYCSTPPKLVINGRQIGFVSANPYVNNRIPIEGFLYTLKNDIQSLLAGRIIESESQARLISGESFIEAGDGTFLGKINPNKFDSDSIFNQFSLYGNKFSQLSIFNKFSNYGNQFNQLSPYNQFSNNPPKIFVKGKHVAFLTLNKSISPRVHPDELLEWAQRNVPMYG